MVGAAAGIQASSAYSAHASPAAADTCNLLQALSAGGDGSTASGPLPDMVGAAAGVQASSASSVHASLAAAAAAADACNLLQGPSAGGGGSTASEPLPNTPGAAAGVQASSAFSAAAQASCNGVSLSPLQSGYSALPAMRRVLPAAPGPSVCPSVPSPLTLMVHQLLMQRRHR